MTDKQIIIDGVDVSGCLFFTQYGFCTAQLEILGGSGKCSVNNQNCYYKQLKRKEQECEFSNLRIIQLQETLSQYETDLSTKDCIVETCKAQYKELKAENERLKKEIRLYDCIDKWGTKECHCACRCLGNDFCDDADKKIKQLEAENEKLKKDVERWKRNFNGKVSAIEELIKIIQQALEDFSIEVGTPQYDRLLNSAKSLGIGVKDYE